MINAFLSEINWRWIDEVSKWLKCKDRKEMHSAPWILTYRNTSISVKSKKVVKNRHFYCQTSRLFRQGYVDTLMYRVREYLTLNWFAILIWRMQRVFEWTKKLTLNYYDKRARLSRYQMVCGGGVGAFKSRLNKRISPSVFDKLDEHSWTFMIENATFVIFVTIFIGNPHVWSN